MRADITSLLELFLATILLCSTYTQSEDEAYDTMGTPLPGTQAEFKIDIWPGAEECFYQHLRKGAEFYVSFEVLRGADRNIDVYVKKPDGQIMDKHLWTSEGQTEKTVDMEGDYAVCIDNAVSRFSSKLVYIFVASFIEKEWAQFAEDAKDVDTSLDAAQETVKAVGAQVAQINQLMGLGRVRSVKDYYLALTNNKTVQNMSIISIIVFIMTSAIQVAFVRNMFNTKNVTPTQKPRA